MYLNNLVYLKGKKSRTNSNVRLKQFEILVLINDERKSHIRNKAHFKLDIEFPPTNFDN